MSSCVSSGAVLSWNVSVIFIIGLCDLVSVVRLVHIAVASAFVISICSACGIIFLVVRLLFGSASVRVVRCLFI